MSPTGSEVLSADAAFQEKQEIVRDKGQQRGSAFGPLPGQGSQSSGGGAAGGP